MKVEVTYVEYHTKTVEISDEYRVLVEYEKSREGEVWGDRMDEIDRLAELCAHDALKGIVSAEAYDAFCNEVYVPDEGVSIYEA